MEETETKKSKKRKTMEWTAKKGEQLFSQDQVHDATKNIKRPY